MKSVSSSHKRIVSCRQRGLPWHGTWKSFQHRAPSGNELGKYINHMKELVGKQHAYIAQVAVHVQTSQQIEYEPLTKHITGAFDVCNRVLTRAF